MSGTEKNLRPARDAAALSITGARRLKVRGKLRESGEQFAPGTKPKQDLDATQGLWEGWREGDKGRGVWRRRCLIWCRLPFLPASKKSKGAWVCERWTLVLFIRFDGIVAQWKDELISLLRLKSFYPNQQHIRKCIIGQSFKYLKGFSWKDVLMIAEWMIAYIGYQFISWL